MATRKAVNDWVAVESKEPNDWETVEAPVRSADQHAAPTPTPPAGPLSRFFDSAVVGPIKALGQELGDYIQHGPPARRGFQAMQTQANVLREGREPTSAESAVIARMGAPGDKGNIVGELSAPVTHAGRQMASGDVAGGLGTLTAVAAPVAAGGMAAKVAPSLRRSSYKNYADVLNPTTKRMKATAEAIIPEVAERGVIARSRSSLTKKIGENVDRAASAIDETLERVPEGAKMLPEQRITDSIRRAGDDRFTIADSSGGRALKSPDAAAGVALIDELADSLKSHRLVDASTGDFVVPFEKLNQIRQNWDNVVAAKGGYTPGSVDFATAMKTQAYREAAGAIRNELAGAFPESAAAKREFSFWKKLQDVNDSTNTRKVGQRTPLTEQVTQAMGGAIGAMTGDGVVAKATGAVAGRSIAKSLQQLLDSTAWKTTSAQAKMRLAKALESGNDVAVRRAIVGANAASVRSRQNDAIPTPPTGPPAGPIE